MAETKTERLHVPISPRVKRIIKQAAEIDRRSMATIVELAAEKYCLEIIAAKGSDVGVVSNESH